MKKSGYLKYSLLFISVLFIVGCPPSSVTILNPSEGDHFEVGNEITFTGTAMDPLEGELSGDSLVWTSNIDGEIGTGTEFVRDDLSEGTHSIILTAKNSRGLERTATITITISGGTVTTTTTTIDGTTTTTTPMPMEIVSLAFTEGATIPVKYTCNGADTSPDLTWSNAPAGTKSFVLIMDDHTVTWDHWVVFDIPSTTNSVQEGQEPQGTKGKNTWGNLGYGGPCPPSGTHSYVFTIYALDGTLGLAEGATGSAVNTAMVGHILDQASLTGKYQ